MERLPDSNVPGTGSGEACLLVDYLSILSSSRTLSNLAITVHAFIDFLENQHYFLCLASDTTARYNGKMTF